MADLVIEAFDRKVQIAFLPNTKAFATSFFSYTMQHIYPSKLISITRKRTVPSPKL